MRGLIPLVSLLVLLLGAFLCYWFYYGFSHNYLAGLETITRIQIYKNEQQVAGAELWQHTFSTDVDREKIQQICSYFKNNVSQLGQDDRWLLYSAVFDNPDQTGEESITIAFNSSVLAGGGHCARMHRAVYQLLTQAKQQ